jgi:hypothetical protein
MHDLKIARTVGDDASVEAFGHSVRVPGLNHLVDLVPNGVQVFFQLPYLLCAFSLGHGCFCLGRDLTLLGTDDRLELGQHIRDNITRGYKLLLGYTRCAMQVFFVSVEVTIT